MLDDLGGPAFKGPDPGLKFLRLPADLDLPETLTFPGAAQQGKAALLRFVRPFRLQDFRIEHGGVAAALLEDDDPSGHSDHIGGHAHAALLMVQQGIHQIPGGVQVIAGCRGGFSGQEKGIVDQFSNHIQAPFDLKIRAAHKPPNMTSIANRRMNVNKELTEDVYLR